MAELNEQVHIEDHTLVEDGQDPSTTEAVRYAISLQLPRLMDVG